MTCPLIDDLASWLKRWQVSKTNHTWVVAVSGGSDSVGLLRALHACSPELGLNLSVAHLNHGVRGLSARADAEFVSQLANALDLPFDLGHWSPHSTRQFEVSARRARHAWLGEIALARNASVVALGHTKDDQAETILHRILRGTGLHGLSGISQVRKFDHRSGIRLVRPLLAISRLQIREYLASLGQSYREDETNADITRTRSRIRHDLLPKLAADYNLNIVNALVQLGGLAQASGQALAPEISAIAHNAIIQSTQKGFILKQSYLRSIPVFLRAEVFRLLWRIRRWPEADMSAERWGRLAALVDRDNFAPVMVGAGVQFLTDGSHLLLRRTIPADADASSHLAPHNPIPLDLPGTAPVPWAGGRIIATTDPHSPRHESISLARLEPPLIVREPVAGDRFQPLGMHGKSTPLADFFRARKVPRSHRPHTPLVCDARGIVWVVGHRIAERVKVSSDTDATVGLTWETKPPAGAVADTFT